VIQNFENGSKLAIEQITGLMGDSTNPYNITIDYHLLAQALAGLAALKEKVKSE
jgi:hypothetical protein